jgi:hypothetical protein
VTPPPVDGFETVAHTILDDEELARVDALARLYGATRDEMFARLFRTGLLVTEKQARQARGRGEGEGGGS